MTSAPALPTVSGTDPASPAASTTPKVKGTADAGSTVDVYATSDCSGAGRHWHRSSVRLSRNSGDRGCGQHHHLPREGHQRQRQARLLDHLGDLHQHTATPPPAAPDTTITKAPKKTVKTTKKRARVSFQFVSTVAGSTFACSIDGKAFTACTSGVTYKLKAGKHIFAVRATAAGVTDPTPATYSFKVKRKKRH